jgi:hypothetical protein
MPFTIFALPCGESGSAGFTNTVNTGLQPGVAHSGDDEIKIFNLHSISHSARKRKSFLEPVSIVKNE